MTDSTARGILWRLDLAQRCIRKAERASEEGDPERAVRLARYAKSLMSECDVEDYANGRATGRVVTVRPPPDASRERAELLERMVSDREEYFSPERDLRAHDSHARRAV